MQWVKGSSADINPITTRLKELVGGATNNKSYWDGGMGDFMQHFCLFRSVSSVNESNTTQKSQHVAEMLMNAKAATNNQLIDQLQSDLIPACCPGVD